MNRESPELADLPTDEIVRRILAGDRNAYRHIVNRYQSRVMAIAHAMLADQGHVEDVVQKVFIKAFRSLDRFELDASFGLWIKGIARNTVRDEIRKNSRYSKRVAAFAELTESRLDEAGRDLFREEVQEALIDCISRLEEDAARAVRMHYLERRKTDEIGDILGRSGGAIRTLMHRARAALRECLVEKGAVS